ncbi:hypothetical protein HU200_061915 [Digitaria exilis]|uniref:SAM domain-containing protein n=1 Tax=Digitaria exilis TaxID=1010633 RepID=A0A835A6B3_9POAL|nr:hypothetical protein HU200_061915 [Digitaria exilis]
MYADRSSGRKRSVRDRLGSAGGSRPRSDDAKRFRRDDGTWRRELYNDSVVTQTSSGPSSRNLQSSKNSQVEQRIEVPKPVRETVNNDRPVKKRDPPPTVAPPVIKKVSAPAPVPAPPAAVPAPPALQQSQEKVDASLESLLKSLDLEKYLINFQAEEVDMKAMAYMSEEDLKVLGIPMGPRKKILSALAHKKRKSSKSLPTS